MGTICASFCSPSRGPTSTIRTLAGKLISLPAFLQCTKTPTLPDVTGKQFAVYPTGDLRKVVSDDKTEVDGYGIGDSILTSAFRDGLYCVRGRVKYNQPESTEEVCSKLVEWSSDAILALDPQSGKVLQWWVEHHE